MINFYTDDVLEENQACKEENERLRDVIDKDIRALKDNLTALEAVVDHNGDIMNQIGSDTTMNKNSIEENSLKITNTTIRLNALEFEGEIDIFVGI